MPTKAINLRIDTELLEYLQKRADKEHRTLSNMIISILLTEKECDEQMQSPYDYKIGFDEADNRWKKKIEDIKAEIDEEKDLTMNEDINFAEGLERALIIIDKHTVTKAK